MLSQPQDLGILSAALAAAVKKILKDRGGIFLSQEPETVEKNIVEFGRRMRVDALEKFGDRTVFSAVKFYVDGAHMSRDEAAGALVVYIPVMHLAHFLKMLEYPEIDEEVDEALMDGCGTVANLIAGAFVKDIAKIGFGFLQMSHFETYINTAVNGIEFSPEEKIKHEITFMINGQKRLVAELTMGRIPKYV
jgi:hypothetical protein